VLENAAPFHFMARTSTNAMAQLWSVLFLGNLVKRAVLKRTTRPLKILYMLIGIVTDRPIVKQKWGRQVERQAHFVGPRPVRPGAKNLFRGHIRAAMHPRIRQQQEPPRMACVLKQVTSKLTRFALGGGYVD